MRKKHFIILVMGMLLLVGCTRKEENLFGDPLVVATSILDHILYQEETEISQRILVDSEKIISGLKKSYYSVFVGVNNITEDEAIELTERLFINIPKTISYELTIKERKRKNVIIEVNYKTYDEDKMYAKYMDIFTLTNGIEDMGKAEQEKAGIVAYLEVYNYLEQGEKIYTFDIPMEKQKGSWSIQEEDMKKLLLQLATMMVGGDREE